MPPRHDPSSALIHPPPAYMTTTTTLVVSFLIICCLASAGAAAVAAAAAAAAGVINVWSLIMAIEQEGSKPSFDTLGQCHGTARVDGLHWACCGSPGGGSGGGCLSLPATKVDKKTTHQSTSTWQEEEATDKKRWRPRQTGGSGTRRGGCGNTITGQGG
jgi:hypothetical protein